MNNNASNNSSGQKMWKYKIRFSWVFPLVVSLILAGGAAFIVMFSLNVISDIKGKDARALIYLELEMIGHQLQAQISDMIYEVERKDASRAIKVLMNEDNLTGKNSLFAELTPLEFIGISPDPNFTKTQFTRVKGKTYLVRIREEGEKRIAVFYRFRFEKSVMDKDKLSDRSLVFIMTERKKLIFANHSQVKQASLNEMALVQHYLRTPLNYSFFELGNSMGNEKFGFFYSIPNTNLIVFAETSDNLIKEEIWSNVAKIAKVSSLIVIFLCLLAYLYSYKVSSSIRQLVWHCQKIGQGFFEFRFINRHWGEMGALQYSFSNLGNILAERDNTIQNALVVEKEERRLKVEWQKKLDWERLCLPKARLLQNKFVDLAISYRSHLIVSGDWFNYFFDEKNGYGVFCMAEFSTNIKARDSFALVANQGFMDLIHDKPRDFIKNAIPSFADYLSRAVTQKGDGRWSVQLIAGMVDSNRDSLHLYNWGFTKPVLINAQGNRVKLKIGSDPIGMEPAGSSLSNSMVYSKVPFCEGDVFGVFSDGLIYSKRNPHGLRRRQLIKNIEKSRQDAALEIARELELRWTSNLNEDKWYDDSCLLIVKCL